MITCNQETAGTDKFISNFYTNVKYIAKYGNSNFNNKNEWIEIAAGEIDTTELTNYKALCLEIYYSKVGRKEKQQYVINYAKYVTKSRTTEVSFANTLQKKIFIEFKELYNK